MATRAIIAVCASAVLALSGCRAGGRLTAGPAGEVTFQEALQARTEVVALAEEAVQLPAEVRGPMRKVLATAAGRQAAGDICLVKDRYAEALKAYDDAAAHYLRALDATAVLEYLAEARCRAARARMPAETAARPRLEETTVDLGGGVKMEFVLIPAGTFRMGSEKDQRPVHAVKIGEPFCLGKYEVTQEQWKAVMGTAPSRFGGAKNPVEEVSWDDCQAFMRKFGEKGPGAGFRLPTEAEREYACRAGSQTEYAYGDDETRLGQYAWYKNNSGKTTHPVGQKKPNAWGLCDMHGNVWEWTADWHGEYSPEVQTDPTGAATGQYRVLRGGSWNHEPVYLRSAFRNICGPTFRNDEVGFRCVLVGQ